MTENNGSKAGVPTREPGVSDLVSLDEPASRGESAASSQDSILNAANEFEAQLEQMSAWKHQLAQQMEVMRRDGIKLLERQKSLAIEKKKLLDERETLKGDREQIEKLHQQLAEETKALRERESEVSRQQGELKQLEGERAKWEEEVRAAAAASEALEKRRAEAAGQIEAAESRLKEIEELLGQRDAVEAQIAAAKATLAEIETHRATAEAARQELTQKEAELLAREKSLAEQEARHLEQDVQLKNALEQLEEQRRQLAETQRALLHERENFGAERNEKLAALDQKATELAAREEAWQNKNAEQLTHEDLLLRAKEELQEAQVRLKAQQEKLIADERALAEKKLAAEEDLRAQLATAEKGRKLAEEERNNLLKQRRELEKKLDDMEAELTAQLETLAKQTKRLADRRAELDARTEELEKEYQQRLERETETLRDELARAQRSYEQKAAALQQQIEQAAAGSGEWEKRESLLRANLDKAAQQIASGKQEIGRLTAELETATRQRDEQAAQAKQQQAQLREQIALQEAAIADWQKKLESATAAAQAISQSQNASAAEQSAVADELAAAQKQIAALQGDLAQAASKLQQAEARQRELEQHNTAGAAAENERVQALATQVSTLEKQRDDLAAQLFSIQDSVRRQSDDAILAKNVLEGELIELRRRYATLEAERSKWQSPPSNTHPHSPQASQVSAAAVEQLRQLELKLDAHRGRLIRQAKSLRFTKQQLRESKRGMQKSTEDIAQQREQLRMRKENLEQVKRLLEKQEMVMARKLADHNALKTVAAVGIFVIMVLGSVFFGVYKFATPTYRSEAVVQLAPPAGMQGKELEAWLTRQMSFIRTQDVTFTAWKVLRSPDEHYAMHDVREDWLNSLDHNLSMQLDTGTRTLAIRYIGPNADGVAQVCNALATAYTSPAIREGGEDTKTWGTGATVIAKAAPPLYPTVDNRVMTSLSVVAVVLFVSLVLVMVFRYYIARQLREIDQMADEEDLEDISAEMPADATPA